MPSSAKKKKTTPDSKKGRSPSTTPRRGRSSATPGDENATPRRSRRAQSVDKADVEMATSPEVPTPTVRKSPRRPRTEVTKETTTASPKKKKVSPKKTKKASPATNGGETPSVTPARQETPESTPAKRAKTATNDNMDTTPPTKPTMDVQVHRLRHFDFIPSPLLAMAASPSGGYVALARENGSCELHEVTSVQEHVDKSSPHVYPLSTIAGSKRAVAHSLCWVPTVKLSSKALACVAASPDGTLWMVDFSKSQLQSRISSGGGGVFDLVACGGYGTSSPRLPLVAGACQDGSVRIWQVSHSGIQEPPLVTLPSAGAAVLSLAWRVRQSKTRADGSCTIETVLFAGVSDGTIRKYHMDFGVSPHADNEYQSVEVQNQTAVMRMTVESRGRRTATKVWTMQALQDDTLVTGNSLGQVQFWNSSTGTLLQSMEQTELKADVLQLVVNQQQTKVFASGVDSRVVCLERRGSQPGESQWRFTTAQRPHTHDVKCMVMVPASGRTDNSDKHSKQGRRLETLLTGGVDTKLCSYVASEFTKRRPQVWYPWPSSSPISTSAERRIISMQRETAVELYRLNDDASKAPPSAGSQLLSEIAIETLSNLVASSISPNGKWLAACNAASLFVFALEDNTEPQKVTLPKELERACVVAMHFHENTLIVADSSNKVYAIDLRKEDDVTYTTLEIPVGSQSREPLPVSSIHTSASGMYLVVMNKQSEEAIHIFKRKGESYHPYWTLPGLSGARPSAIALIQDSQLAVATVKSHVYLFDLDNCKLSSWSEERGFPIKNWPFELTNRKDFPVRLSVNPKDPTQLIMKLFNGECTDGTKQSQGDPRLLIDGNGTKQSQDDPRLLIDWTEMVHGFCK